ncbi:oligosaccharide flippase family protein [Klebsiella pneumoniae]|nr:oligosaccharide flippase family protein [Klebsiella pneumoniae]
MGIVLAIIVFSSSPLIANFYQQPQLIPILMMLSITFPLSGYCCSSFGIT